MLGMFQGEEMEAIVFDVVLSHRLLDEFVVLVGTLELAHHLIKQVLHHSFIYK